MQQQPIPHPLAKGATIELDHTDRQLLLDLYRIHLAAIERLERLLCLPPSRPTRAERRSERIPDER
jgi:hypothetical protein